MTVSHKVLLTGGIGDFLQSLPFLLSAEAQNTEIYVMSHQISAQSFFKGLGIKVKEFFYFDDFLSEKKVLDEINQLGEILPCQRFQYLNSNPFKESDRVFSKTKKTVGIHLGGSTYSIAIQKQIGLVTKNLPSSLIYDLAKLDFNFLLFGSASEIEVFGVILEENIATVCHEDISISLSYVNQCDAFVASDSAFKTLSAMLRIPTLVWLGDYVDANRDNLFINPYVIAGEMDVFRYSNLADPKQIKMGLKRTENFLSEVFNPPSPKIHTTLFASSYGPMILNLRDRGVSCDIMQSGFFETAQIDLLTNIVKFLLSLKRNLVVYDVGANVGTHALALAKINQSRIRVRAFEVQSKVFYMLCGTIALNGLGNVNCHHAAVGDRSDIQIEVNVPDYSMVYNYDGFEVENIQKSDNQNMIKSHSEFVKMVTIDYFNEIVDFIKIDVEGMEEKVLEGAKKTIENSSPICFVEFFKSNIENLHSFFKDKNYHVYQTNQDILAIPISLNLEIKGIPMIF
jgi:FkbM family methyltransferase